MLIAARITAARSDRLAFMGMRRRVAVVAMAVRMIVVEDLDGIVVIVAVAVDVAMGQGVLLVGLQGVLLVGLVGVRLGGRRGEPARLAGKDQEPHPEHVERREHRADRRHQEQHEVLGILVHSRQRGRQDRVLRIQPAEARHARDRQRADEHGPSR